MSLLLLCVIVRATPVVGCRVWIRVVVEAAAEQRAYIAIKNHASVCKPIGGRH